MATITTATFLDSAARSAGEAMTINTGGQLTVRTDTRNHANAPVSNLGSLGSVTINEGKLIWDSTAVRWLPYNNGSGNAPAIGTIITQGGASGYLLGVWTDLINVPVTPLGAIQATGFLKFREVTGSFSAGALTGISATATGPDVQGWIAIAHDAASNFTIPRLGEHRARGGRFFLDNTNGSIGQVFQVPCIGQVMYAPGLWIETGVGTGYYEYWPGLFSATNGWAHQHIGEAEGATDARQNFLKILAGGRLQMGESYTQASTYVSLAAQVMTYAEISRASTYTWANDVIEVYYSFGHLLETGQQTGLEFTSGGAVGNNGIYTVTVTSPYHFTVSLAGSGAGGNVNSKPGVTVGTLTHGMNIGESVYCNFFTGTGVSGSYEIYAVPTTGTFLIKYPHVAAITGGDISCLHTLVITFAAHGMAVGNKVRLDFTSGTGVDGEYTIKGVATNTYNVNFAHAATTSGNVTMKRTIGNIAPAGCRTWIPSNILVECTTANRSIDTVPNTTQASRPEWITTSAGAIDLEYVYACSGFPTFAQAYSIRMRECAFFDQIIISECATALDIDGVNLSMQGAMDLVSLILTSNFAGGTIANGKFHRGNAPGTTDHAASIQYCKGITFNNVQTGIIQFVRSTGYPWAISYCDTLVLNNCRSLNGNITFVASNYIDINNHDHCDRFTGRTNGTTAVYAVSIGAPCGNITINNLTFGYAGDIQDCHPFSGVVSCSNDNNIKVRNIGSKALPLNGGTWAPNAYGMALLGYTNGNNNTIKFQRCYVDKVRTGHIGNINSDKNILYESVDCGFYVWSTKALMSVAHAELNGQLKLFKSIHLTTGQASVYGTHFIDILMGNDYGRFILAFNEPTAETASIFTMNSGTAKWNSSGGILLGPIGTQATWQDSIFRKGYTGFAVEEAVLTGPTQTRFLVEYQIDAGAGFSDWHNCYRLIAATGGTSGQYTFTLANSTGLEVGDYCFGTGLSAVGIGTKNPTVPKITNINGTTITVNVANTATVSGNIRFNHLPFETIDPAVGFKLKYRLTVTTTETVACTSLRVGTLTTAAAQSENLYPLDTITFGLSGLVTGSDITLLASGTETVLDNKEDNAGTTYSYTYETPQTVDITVYKPGYIPAYIRNYALGTTNTSLPIQQVADPSYLE